MRDGMIVLERARGTPTTEPSQKTHEAKKNLGPREFDGFANFRVRRGQAFRSALLECGGFEGGFPKGRPHFGGGERRRDTSKHRRIKASSATASLEWRLGSYDMGRCYHYLRKWTCGSLRAREWGPVCEMNDSKSERFERRSLGSRLECLANGCVVLTFERGFQGKRRNLTALGGGTVPEKVGRAWGLLSRTKQRK